MTALGLLPDRHRDRAPRPSVARSFAGTAFWIVAAALAADVTGQSYVRGWGHYTFDSSAHDVSDFVEVEAGPRYTLALRSNGAVMSWGGGTFSFGHRVPALALPATRIAAGSKQALALLSDGTISVWGSDYSGQGAPNLVVPALPPGMTYVDISSGYISSAAIRSDGEVVTWGDPSHGQNNVPALPTGVTYVAVDSGDDHHVALRSDGQVVAWGRNQLGQLNVPALPPGVTFTAIDCSAYSNHTLALRSDGEVVAWGDNSSGQSSVPSLPAGTSYTAIGAGVLTSTALRSDGQVIVWGQTTYGQGAVPALPPGVTWVQLAAGNRFCTGRRSDGRVVCWGENENLACNVPSVSGAAPVAVDAGKEHVAALLSDGTLQHVGYRAPAPQALPSPPPGVRFERIAVQYFETAALRSDGEVVSTSFTAPPLPPGMSYVDVDTSILGLALVRSDGQIFTTSATPVPALPSGVTYVEVDTSYTFAARRSDGEVVAWGMPSTNNNVTPLPAGIEYVEIAMGWAHTIGRRSDGSIANWGRAVYGSGPTAPAPPLPAGVTYVEIAAGYHHSLARRSDGSIVAWEHDPAVAATSYRGTIVAEYTGVPGATYNGIGVGERQSVAIMGPTSTYVTYGTGCAGSLPAARLVPLDTPKLGSDLVVRLFDLPASAAFFTAGFSDSSSAFGALPQSVATFGMPGCTAYASAEFVAFVGGANNQAVHTLPIPNDSSLLGVTFYNQAIVPDPGANAAGLVLSDAAAAVIGR